MVQIKEIIARLKVVYGAKTNKELAQKMGVKYQTLNTWIKRNKIPYDHLMQIGQNDPIDLNWLFTGEKENAQKLYTDAYNILQLDLQASAGHGIEVFETAGTPVILDKALFRHPVQPQHLRIIHVVGDSMEPTIPDGSHIVIDTSRHDTVDGIYVIRFDDRIMVKRLQFRLDGTTEILSDNPHYQSQLYDPSQTQQELQVIGRKILTIH